MDDAPCVCDLERAQDGTQYAPCLMGSQRSLALDVVRERSAREVLHLERPEVVRQLVYTMQSDDVRAGELRHHPRLAEDALSGLGLVLDGSDVHDLQCDGTMEEGVLGAVDGRVRPAPDHLVDIEVPESRTRLDGTSSGRVHGELLPYAEPPSYRGRATRAAVANHQA